LPPEDDDNDPNEYGRDPKHDNRTQGTPEFNPSDRSISDAFDRRVIQWQAGSETWARPSIISSRLPLILSVGSSASSHLTA
jgi:hypothetical protein